MGLGIKGNFHNRRNLIKFNLPIIKFQEEKVYFFYTPALDLTGYGKTEKEAKASFEETLSQFLDYTTNKKTLSAEIFEEKAYTKFDHPISLPAIA